MPQKIEDIRILAGVASKPSPLAESLPTSLVNRIARLTDRNHHSEAYRVVAAEVLKDKELAEVFAAINTIQNYYGHLHPTLRPLRDEMYDRLMAKAKAKLSPEMFQAVYSAL